MEILRTPALKARIFMTSPSQDIVQSPPVNGDKETNFRKFEERYQRQIEAEKAEKEEIKQQLAQLQSQLQRGTNFSAQDEDDDEPYVSPKKLQKRLDNFGEYTKKQTQSDIKNAVSQALAEERKQQWLKTNTDFYDVMKHANKLAETNPDLAESILSMPEGFERQQLVYKNLKALRLHEDAKPQPSIQDKIDANRRSPYYQPSGVGAAPYGHVGDFSPVGQKSAYDKMQELKARLKG